MKHTLTALVIGVALLLASGGVGYAQDFQKGLEAAQKGDQGDQVLLMKPILPPNQNPFGSSEI